MDKLKVLVAVFILSMALILSSSSMVLAGGRGAFGLGIEGGGVFSITEEALEGFPETDFKSGWTVGGYAFYRWKSGFILGVNGEYFSMGLEELDVDFGKVKAVPVMLFIGYQGMPSEGKGLTGHGYGGIGVSFNSFDKGPAVKELEETLGVTYTIDVDNSVVGKFCGGIDYFFSRNLSLNVDCQMLITNAGTSWKVDGVEIPDVEKFYLSNIRVIGGLKFWF